jgi:hypothetical protein
MYRSPVEDHPSSPFSSRLSLILLRRKSSVSLVLTSFVLRHTESTPSTLAGRPFSENANVPHRIHSRSISTSCCASGRTVSYGRTRLDSELPRDDKPFTRLVGTVVPGKGATTAKKVLPSPLRCRSQATPYTAYNPPQSPLPP